MGSASGNEVKLRQLHHHVHGKKFDSGPKIVLDVDQMVSFGGKSSVICQTKHLRFNSILSTL